MSELVRWRPPAPLRHLAGAASGWREAGGGPGRHRGLPSPALTVILTLDEPLHLAEHPDPRDPPGAYEGLLGGLHTRPALVVHDGRQSGVQLELDPLGARAVLGLPAGALAGRDVHAEDVLGPRARRLRERLGEAPDWPARFAVLQRWLAAAPPAEPSPEVRRAWALLRRSGGRTSVAALCADVGWGERHLRARFRAEVGLSPKQAGRVVRFDRARRLLQRPGAGSVAEVAARCGYADQAHLARDFRELAGAPPTRWLADERAGGALRSVQDAAGAGAPGSTA
ncbi:AraC family transcriptional regulator [Vallicoccus soli]|uniref:AraC family transcriptional regulator n=1 Tax=Vallicoccus soli TaxID=2339232 RepID=A0A3A3Z0X7_9ACTN|nr:AraC family transcriptional regulator [Vallicoccus soli]